MYVQGRNVLKEILENNYKVKKIYFSDSKNVDKSLKDLYEESLIKGYNCQLVDSKKLKNLSDTSKNQGVVVDIGKEFNYSEESILYEKEEPFFVILDQVQDPHNFGAIVRSAVASGVDAIIIPKDNSCGVTSTVIKVSSGQIFKLPIVQVTNLSRTIDRLKDNNIWVYSADMNGQNYFDINMQGGFCLVMGNEGSGVRKNIKDHSDGIVSIPMLNNVESLNVSVSAGVIMFEALKQRRLKWE